MNDITIKIQRNISEENLNIKLVDLMCKHVLNTYGKKAKCVLQYSMEYCSYPHCFWGEHDNHAGDLKYHIMHINKMEKDMFEMPIRIIKCKYPFSDEVFYWADNLHSTVRNIRRYGKRVTLREVDFYIVDITEQQHVKLISYNESIRENLADICNIVGCAYNRYTWSNNEKLIDIRYTVGDFLDDNPELYTCFNTKIGLRKDTDGSETVFEKSRAFNSLYDPEKYM